MTIYINDITIANITDFDTAVTICRDYIIHNNSVLADVIATDNDTVNRLYNAIHNGLSGYCVACDVYNVNDWDDYKNVIVFDFDGGIDD